MKKGIAIFIGLLVIGVIIFIPVMIYGGFQVNIVEGTFTLNSSSTSSQSYVHQAVGPSITSWNMDLSNGTRNAWGYAVDGINGRNEIEDSSTDTTISLELSIKFIIKKENETIKEINIGVTHGDGEHTVDVVLGPDEGLTSSGYYELYIAISLSLQAPGVDLELDHEIGPIVIYIVVNGE